MGSEFMAKSQSFSIRTPYRLLCALFTGCVVLFLVSVPLPHPDNHLIGSDGMFYYAYLPSLILDGDLNFQNQYARSLALNHPARSALSPTGLVPNAYAFGSAFLWSPFFLMAHGGSIGLNRLGLPVPTDGYGYLYESITLIGSMTYGFIGLLLIYYWCARLVAPISALCATILLWFGTNVIYYMVAEPSMSHMTAIFAVTLFLSVWLAQREHPTWQTWLCLGATGGLVALVRQPDATFLVIPFLDSLTQIRSPHAAMQWLTRYGAFIAAGLIVFAPQMLAWQIMYGSLLSSGYLVGSAPAFYWTSPRLFNVLFSTWHGLFTWHPILLAATAGLILLGRHDRRLACLLALGLILQVYVISAWRYWWQGDAFGGRMFISSMPVFALGLAALIERLIRANMARWVISIALALLIWNGLFMIQYRFDFIPMSAPLTFKQLVTEKFTLPFQILSRLSH